MREVNTRKFRASISKQLADLPAAITKNGRTVAVVMPAGRLGAGARQTGKTFRAVLDALGRASSGADVTYCSPTRAASDRAEWMARHILKGLTDHEISGHEVGFIGGARVTFRVGLPTGGDHGRDHGTIEDLD